MELRQAGKDEAQGDEQFAENANTGATFSKCFAVRKCPEFGPEILEFINAIF